MSRNARTNPPGAIGSGLYRAASSKPHGWSGEWHLRQRKKLDGLAEVFTRDARHSGAHMALSRSRDLRLGV